MARQKSPHGEIKRVQLRYRENDPRYAGLIEMIQSIPERDRNTRLLDALVAGLSSELKAGGPASPAVGIPTIEQPDPVQEVPREHSSGFASMVGHDWGGTFSGARNETN